MLRRALPLTRATLLDAVRPSLALSPPTLSASPHGPAEPDLQPIFEPFGPLDFVRLQRDATGQATGIGFVQ